jgi:putative alpha-1,2-mannosidase
VGNQCGTERHRSHTGVARFSFPGGKAANILVPVSHTLNHTSAASVRLVGDRRIEGFVENHAFCDMKPTYKVYFVMTFSQPFSSFGTWMAKDIYSPGTIAAGSRLVEQGDHQSWVGAYASWGAEQREQTITAKIGISYVDVAGAEKKSAGGGRKQKTSQHYSQAKPKAAWKKELSIIDVPRRYSRRAHECFIPRFIIAC